MNESQRDLVRETLAAVFIGSGKPLELRKFMLPQPADGESIVRVECCTMCGSDLHTLTGARVENTPSILGHEICGTVCDVGISPLRDVAGKPLEIGDRVTWSTSVSCGKCDRCAKGLPQKCRSLSKYGHESIHGDWPLSGGLSEYVQIRSGSAVVRLPREIPAEVICPVNCATATVVAAISAAGGVTGARVLIFGAGMLGLTAAAFAKESAARSVTVCDRDQDRLALATQFGADAVLEWHPDPDELRSRCLERSGHVSFDVILEVSGSADAVEAACLLGDVGAKVVLVGSVMKSRPVSIDPESLVRRWMTVQGVHNYAPQDLQTAVEFLVQHHSNYPFASLVERQFQLAQVNDAVHYAVEHKPVRIAVVP